MVSNRFLHVYRSVGEDPGFVQEAHVFDFFPIRTKVVGVQLQAPGMRAKTVHLAKRVSVVYSRCLDVGDRDRAAMFLKVTAVSEGMVGVCLKEGLHCRHQVRLSPGPC